MAINLGALQAGFAARRIDAQSTVLARTNDIMALANLARPDMTPAELVALQQKEKSLVQDKHAAQSEKEFLDHMEEFVKTLQKREVNKRLNRISWGWIFGS